MQTHHVLYIAGVILLAAAAVEQFYVHPSYGTGLKALVTVIQASGV